MIVNKNDDIERFFSAQHNVQGNPNSYFSK